MAKTRTQKALYNSASSLAAEIVSLLCGLVLPRLILSNFGSAYNGISSSVAQLLGSVSILTVGITGATRVALYRTLADNDVLGTSRIIKATEQYMHKVGYVMLALLAVLIAFYPFVVDTGYSWAEVAPLILAAGISAAGQYFVGLTYSALLMADQSIYITNLFLIITNVLNLIVTFILIRLGCSIQTVRLMSSLVLVLNPIMRAAYVKKKYRLIKDCEPDQSALSMRKDVMAHSLANIVHDHTDIIVLTVFCDIKIVSVYTVYNLVMNALKRTQMVFSKGTEAIFGSMLAKGEQHKIASGLVLFEFIIGVFASVVFSTAYVVILPFISLYTKGVSDVEYVLPTYAAVIITAQMFFAIRTPYLTLVHGAGHYKQTKNGAYMEAAINLTSSVILVKLLGIVGVAIGTLLANLFRTGQYALYVDNHFVLRGKTVFLLRILWGFSNIILTILISSALHIQQYAGRGWMEWILGSTLTVAIAALVTGLSSWLFYRKDLFAALRMLKRSFGRRRKK